ncbi:hypothetical protein MSAN_01851400 [Mycena sanguinolenta]|uniref:Uncharacterized protein n=1 Tax=Mycena sanguinolenta TaxID=230812 RepID=A0A8H6XT38_9AGAR|nr:hypothetical protein MSAN_01851400 [Mycena sanguinolenta]
MADFPQNEQVDNPIRYEPGWSLLERPTAIYSRPLLGSELMCDQFAQFYDGLAECCMGFTFTSGLQHEELISRTRHSLAQLRFVCPIIAASIDTVHDSVLRSFVYEPASDSERVLAWATESVIIREHVDVETFISTINQTRLPYTLSNGALQILRCFLLLSPNGDMSEHSIFFHGSHTIMDARPTFKAFSLLLEFMSKPSTSADIKNLAWGTEWKNLPAGPVTSTGGPRPGWNARGVELLDKISNILSNPIATHSLLPSREAATIPGKPVRVHRTLSVHDSARLLRALKEVQFTVTHLFEAAQAFAIFTVNPVSESEAPNAHITWPQGIISLGRWQVPPYNAKNFQVISSHTLVPIQVKFKDIDWSDRPRERMLSLMKRLREEYNTFMTNPHLPHLMAAQVTLHPPRKPYISLNPCSTTITNMGVIDQDFCLPPGNSNEADLQVHSMSFGHRVTTPNPQTHVWTFNSKIYLQIEANDVWDQAYLQMYLDTIVGNALEFME